MQLKKYLTFVLVFAVWLAADLWTKNWADTSLGNPFHPLVVRVSADEEGKTLGELLASRFSADPSEVSEDLLPHTSRLGPKVAMKAGATVYGDDGAPRAPGYYVFWRGGDELPPARVDKVERVLLANWMRLAAPKADPNKIRQLVDAQVDGLTYETWLSERIRGLSEERAATVAAEGLHAVTRSSDVAANTAVHAGEVFLVSKRQIDVMGDWFKLVYAENPGAAFGFLRHLDEDLRQPVFMVLTLLAFLVIIGLTIRIPAEARVVTVGMAGILAGAAGNFIDRLRFGYVIDFIDMDLGFMHWPTYNVADIAISVGVGLLILDMLFNKESVLLAKPEPAPAEAKSA